MAPAAANSQDSIWADEMENVDLELMASSSSGGSSLAAAEDGDQGWQRVIYPKKARRQAKLKTSSNGEGAAAVVGADYEALSGFESLEKDAEARQKRRKARQAEPDSKVNHSQQESEDEQDQQQVKKSKAKKAKVTLRTAGAAIAIADLESRLSQLSESPPEIQLSSCTTIFKQMLASVGSGPYYWDSTSREPLAKSLEAPLQDLPDAVRKVTSEFLSKLPVDTLASYVLEVLTELVDNRSKNPPMSNKAKAAYAVVLALILRRKPDAMLVCAERLRSTRFRGPQKLHTLAWAYGQVAKGDPVCGMVIWVQNLLPLATGSSSTPVSRDIALQFIESLGSDRKFWPTLRSTATRKGERLVPPASLISLMYMAYPPHMSRTRATDRFVEIYPLVKDIALAGTVGSKLLKSAAQDLMPLSLQAAGEDVPELSLEGCRLFQWCLVQSPECYKQWETLHFSSLKGSTRALAYLLTDWKETASLLSPLVHLKKTVRAMRVEHAEVIEQDGTRLDVKQADAQCALVQRNMSSVTFAGCFKTTATLVCASAMCMTVYLVSPGVNSWGWDGKVF